MGYGNSKRAVTLVGIVLLTVGLAGCMQGGEGSASVFVKDADTDNFQSINVTFTQVTIHKGDGDGGGGGNQSADGGSDSSGMRSATFQGSGGASRPNTDAAGWQVVFEGTKTIDLLEFNQSDSRAFLGSANLSAGTYNQILIDVESVVGTKDDGSTVNFEVTTGWAKVAGAWQVEDGTNTNLIIDINLERSIVKQGTGDWRFNPVIGRVASEQTSEASRETVRDDDAAQDGGDDTDQTQDSTGSQTTYVKDRPTQNFSEVWIHFTKVEAHYAGNDSWVTTVNESQNVDLLAFNESGSKAFLGAKELKTGRYTQIRIHVTDAWGIDNDGNNKTIEVTQTTAKTAGTWNISANETTQVTIDVNLSRSLHKQGGGQYQEASWRLTPVIGRIITDEGVEDDPRQDQPDSEQDQTQDQTGSQTTYVKDAPTGNFSEVWINLTKVEVHAANASNGTWITVVNSSREVDLLAFNESDSKAFLGESNLSVGRYTQIRIHVNEAWGIQDGNRTNITVTKSPVKVVRSWNITANQTTQVVIDVNLSRSLHKQGGGGQGGGQGGGEWRLTPVIGKVLVDESAPNDPHGDVPDQGEA